MPCVFEHGVTEELRIVERNLEDVPERDLIMGRGTARMRTVPLGGPQVR